MERYRLQEWLTFIGTEIHKGFSPLFNPATPEEYKTMAREKLQQRLQWVDGQLAGKQYLMGDQFTVADGYLFTIGTWLHSDGVDIAQFPKVFSHTQRMLQRPAVQRALA